MKKLLAILTLKHFAPFLLFTLHFSDQAEARRVKVKEAKKRRDERQAVKRQETLKIFAKDDDPAKK